MPEPVHVLLCTCRDTGELQMLRAALEARGVPVRIEGAAVQGVLGMIHGAALAPRVMVPTAWRATARQIAAEIVGPFDDEDDDRPDDGRGAAPPFRTEAPDDDEPDPSEVDDDDDDEIARPTLARRSIAVPFLIAMLAMPWGLAHVYARRPGRGLALMVLAAFVVALWISGVAFAPYALIAVGLLDLVGATVLIAHDNRPQAPTTRSS